MGSPTENQDVAGLHKMPTGIEGFDLITGGGLPRNRTTLLLGGPGSGKTVFALQTLVNGARQFGEPGIFVAFEEGPVVAGTDKNQCGMIADREHSKKVLFLNCLSDSCRRHEGPPYNVIVLSEGWLRLPTAGMVASLIHHSM